MLCFFFSLQIPKNSCLIISNVPLSKQCITQCSTYTVWWHCVFSLTVVARPVFWSDCSVSAGHLPGMPETEILTRFINNYESKTHAFRSKKKNSKRTMDHFSEHKASEIRPLLCCLGVCFGSRLVPVPCMAGALAVQAASAHCSWRSRNLRKKGTKPFAFLCQTSHLVIWVPIVSTNEQASSLFRTEGGTLALVWQTKSNGDSKVYLRCSACYPVQTYLLNCLWPVYSHPMSKQRTTNHGSWLIARLTDVWTNWNKDSDGYRLTGMCYKACALYVLRGQSQMTVL